MSGATPMRVSGQRSGLTALGRTLGRRAAPLLGLLRHPPRGWWRVGVDWWLRSLPLRVVSSVFGASVLVLLLGGLLLMQQVTAGVLQTKQDSVQVEAQRALESAQQTLNSADQTGEVNVDRLLTELALGYANRSAGPDQFEAVIIASGQTITGPRVATSSIPVDLRDEVGQSNDLWLAPTEIRYRDGSPSVPGLVAGSALTLSDSSRYEIYYLFPMTREVETLRVLQAAVITTGALVVILLTFIAALVARQVVTPVRAARQAAESLASGNLNDRITVRGRDDLARLATSMNNMASELQKQIMQLEDLSRVQQRFVSDVSHELRTPLTTVRMAAEVLFEAREEFDPVAARSAELLQAELDRFESLLTDLLEISRFDAGVAVLSLEEVDLRGLVATVVESHRHFAAAAGSEIRLHAEQPCKAAVDSRRVERVVRNLLVNAIEHGEGRPIDVFCEADEQAVAIAVRDHGVGFEASESAQVFLRFWRADPARARTMGGTGLGLAISMEDANLHKGWLTAWGRPGLGAQFRLTLPRDPGTILQRSPLPMVPRDLTPAPLPPGEVGTPDPGSPQPSRPQPGSPGPGSPGPSSPGPSSPEPSSLGPVAPDSLGSQSRTETRPALPTGSAR